MITYRAHVEFIMSAYATDTNTTNTTTQTRNGRFCSIYRKVLLHSYRIPVQYIVRPKTMMLFYRADVLFNVRIEKQSRLDSNV